MKRQIFLFIFLIISFNTYCQKRNAIWCFGDSSGINFNNAGNPVPLFSSLRTRGSSASIADTSGDLLFYANTRAATAGNTTLVWNKQHNLMMNGDSLVGSGWYKEIVITSYPGTDSLYYIFTAGVTGTVGFYYSIIDMKLDSSKGSVVQKNVQLQGANFWANDGITAIKHGNGRDWWIIIRNWYNQTPNDSFYFYLVTPAGIILDHTQNIGDIVIPGFYRIEPSDNGKKIAVCTPNGLLETFAFDRCSGFLFNEFNIEHQVSSNLAPWYWDCELSPNDSLLYVSSNYTQNDSNSYLFQYNLNDTNPALTRVTLFSIKRPVVGGLIELSPDNKIYWSCYYYLGGVLYPDSVRNIYNENLSVINYPDSVGTGCNFQPFSFYLGGKRTYIGLPNNPNYDLAKDSGSICDTLTVGMQEIAIQNSTLIVFYHSAWQKAFINAQKLKGKNYVLNVYDLLGNLIFKEDGKLNSEFYTRDLNMQTFSSGLYIVSLTTEKEKLVKKFVKQ